MYMNHSKQTINAISLEDLHETDYEQAHSLN